MRKTHKIKKTNLEKVVMAKIINNQIIMKPRWYFALGSVMMLVGLISLGILATFLTNLTFFLLKKHGPMGEWRLQQLLESFPVWIPALAIIGIFIGIWMLKNYDFSYKKNFLSIIAMFISAILLTAFLLDYSGLNNIWMRQGPMKRFYEQNTNQINNYPNGSGQGQGRGRMQIVK